VPVDERGYRIAIIESFREWGIYPHGVRTLSVDSLRWQETRTELGGSLRIFVEKNLLELHREHLRSRKDAFTKTRNYCFMVKDKVEHLSGNDLKIFKKMTGLVLDESHQLHGLTQNEGGESSFSVQSVWPAQRIGPDGNYLNEFVICFTQERAIPLNEGRPEDGTFTFRGGCKLILDLDTLSLRYSIIKRIDSERRIQQQREMIREGLEGSLRSTYFGGFDGKEVREPFALLHREY